MSTKYPECTVELLGVSSNAHAIIGKVRRELREYLRSTGTVPGDVDAKIQEFTEEATSGDYDHVLITCHRWVVVI
jgi:hypothetical protein